MEDKISTWQKYIEKIKNTSEIILADKYIFEEYFEIIKNNPKIQTPRRFHLWVTKGFFLNFLITTRNLIDRNTDTISLWNLLNDIRKNNKLLSKEWYINTFKYDWSEVDYKKISRNEDFISQKSISRDLGKLRKLSEKIETYVNDYLAHKSKNPKNIGYKPEYKEVEIFYSEFEKIFKKYYLLLTSKGLSSLTPTIQDNWTSIFTIPWINK